MSLVEQPEHNDDSGTEPGGVRDLLRRCAAARDRHERAELMARLADELTHLADDIAADRERARQHREVVAGLRGQADMARLAAAFDGYSTHAEHSPAC